jgi:hypothetical protein
MLIDDFTSSRSALGTQWSTFTDRVMGGVSDAAATLETIDGTPCLRLRGRVRLERNGGFIQVALPLARGGAPFDASRFRGVSFLARGTGHDYYIHLRSRETMLPWQHHAAAFRTGPAWAPVSLPWSAFEPQGIRTPLAPSGLIRLGLVAAKSAFDADVAIAALRFA